MWPYEVDESRDGVEWREHAWCPTLQRAQRSARERSQLGYYTRVRGPAGKIHVTYQPKEPVK